MTFELATIPAGRSSHHLFHNASILFCSVHTHSIENEVSDESSSVFYLLVHSTGTVCIFVFIYLLNHVTCFIPSDLRRAPFSLRSGL
jgi:hypothetical protein